MRESRAGRPDKAMSGSRMWKAAHDKIHISNIVDVFGRNDQVQVLSFETGLAKQEVTMQTT